MGMLVPCLVALLLFLILSIQISSSTATSYIVGDDAGWSTPLVDQFLYSKWASHKTFKVGDVLVFQYRMGHTVTEVSKMNYEHCIGTDPISTVTDGPVSVTLKTAGDHYFICTVLGHCNYGQKLAITVGDDHAASTLPSATPSVHHFGAEPATAAASPLPSATPNHSAAEPTATASPPPSTAPSLTPSTEESTTATPPSPPKSAGAGGGAGFVLPLLHVFVVLLL